MVLIDGKKFACSACINGHRSSTCNHSDRQLQEIKKKGRPTTHCPHCKDLRKKVKHTQARCVCGIQGSKNLKSASLVAGIGGDNLAPVSDDFTGSSSGIAYTPTCSCSYQDIEAQEAAYGILSLGQQDQGPASQDLAIWMAIHENDPSTPNSPTAPLPMTRQRQSHSDYMSSSDYDSDHCSPPTHHPSSGYAMSNASDDLSERDSNAVQELCACPGCLAYPNNQSLPSQKFQDSAYSSTITSHLDSRTLSNTGSDVDETPEPKGSCCGSNKNKNKSTGTPGIGGKRALNLDRAMSLIGACHQNGSTAMTDEVRQALQQGFGAMDQATLESVKMQHPTHIGSNGVLVCGCGCGRPTVDCADCFRDMCEFVEESQSKMVKDELEFQMSMDQEGRYVADLGTRTSRNMSSGMSVARGTSMELDEEIQSSSDQENQGYRETIGMSLSSQGQEQRQHKRRKLTEQEEAVRLRLLEQEQMQLSKLRPATFNQHQLDSLDDEDWSFVDEIRTDPVDSRSMSGVSH
ncbi:hypothetical protein BGX23_012651 [Mortierella sp. AD031]|nr:hypothetical protein BGX23_012651 [Mortierella sp. AD031]